MTPESELEAGSTDAADFASVYAEIRELRIEQGQARRWAQGFQQEIEAALREAEWRASSAESALRLQEADNEEIRRRLRRRRRVVEILVGFTAPPLIGIVLLIVALTGSATGAVTDSPAVAATALIVGALLLIVPLIAYALSPEHYAGYQGDIERRVREIVRASDHDRRDFASRAHSTPPL